MALIAIAADKGAPGVTTTALALAAVWPRPVLLAECDPAGGDLVYRLPAAGGGRLDPRRGLLSLAVAARRGLQPHQAWEHTQKLNGGLDILTGVTNAEQGAGLNLLWGPVGRVLAANSQADVIADCGRLGVDGPHYDLLAEAALVVLVTRVSLGEVIRLRDRAAAVTAGIQKRGRPGAGADVVVIADYKHFRASIGEIGQALSQANVPARVAGGLADDPKGAELLRGEWGGKLDKSLLIRTARDIAENLAGRLPAIPQPGPAGRAGRGGDKPRDAAAEPYVSPSTWAAAPGVPQPPARASQPAPSGAEHRRTPPAVAHEPGEPRSSRPAQAPNYPQASAHPQAAGQRQAAGHPLTAGYPEATSYQQSGDYQQAGDHRQSSEYRQATAPAHPQAASYPQASDSSQATDHPRAGGYERPARAAEALPAASSGSYFEPAAVYDPAEDAADHGRHSGEPSNGQRGR